MNFDLPNKMNFNNFNQKFRFETENCNILVILNNKSKLIYFLFPENQLFLIFINKKSCGHKAHL